MAKTFYPNNHIFRKNRFLKLEHTHSKCEKCGISTTKLIGHHKDRDKSNHQLDNLQILCTKCHFYEHINEYPLYESRNKKQQEKRKFFRHLFWLNKEDEIQVFQEAQERAGKGHFKNLILNLLKEWLSKQC